MKIVVDDKHLFTKTKKRIKSKKEHVAKVDLEECAKYGLDLLAKNTPIDTGRTASSWSYSIVKTGDKTSVEYKNSNVNNGVPIAIILQYGHGTGTGGWVEGIDYINPVLKTVVEEIQKHVKRAVIES